MSASIVFYVFLLTTLWLIFAHIYSKFLLFIFHIMRSNNSTIFIFAESIFHCNLNLICTLMMAKNLLTYFKIKSYGLLFSSFIPSNNLMLQYTTCNENTQNIMIFVLSYYLYFMISTSLMKSEFLQMLCLICVFIQGYFTRIFGVIFFIGLLSNVMQYFNYFLNVLYKAKKTSESKILLVIIWIFKIFTTCIWMYIFVYLVPICLSQVLFYHRKFYEFSFILFKILYTLYYITEVLHCPFIEYIIKIKIIFINSNLFKRLRNFLELKSSRCKIEMNEAEKTLSMYTAQGKSVEEVRKQLALMQMIKCVITLRKKAKRIRESKNRNTYLEENTENEDHLSDM